MQIRISPSGTVDARLSKRESDALGTTLTTLSFLARNNLFSVSVYRSLVDELQRAKVIEKIESAPEQKQLDLEGDSSEPAGKA